MIVATYQIEINYAKIRPLISLIHSAFVKFAPVEVNYSIDEAINPYYAEHSFKPFSRGKPNRWG